jgi:hypothetical protein
MRDCAGEIGKPFYSFGEIGGFEDGKADNRYLMPDGTGHTEFKVIEVHIPST